jgi:probable rRNA maturation factor
MEVCINDLQEKHQVDSARLQQIALSLLREMKCEERCELSIALVDDDEIHRLNLEYRGIDRPTDVLSFALQEAEAPQVQPDSEFNEIAPFILGDVIISTETTLRQAEEYEYSFDQELRRLLIHGVLHLLGYDHRVDEEARVMEALEIRLARQFANHKSHT